MVCSVKELYVPEESSSSAALLVKAITARIRPEPTLTRATPSFASSGIVGTSRPARILIGPDVSLTTVAITLALPRPGTKMQSAPAFR